MDFKTKQFLNLHTAQKIKNRIVEYFSRCMVY